MKIIVLVLLFISCQPNKKDRLTAFIAGKYTRYSEHEFGFEYDTLVIEMVNKEDKIFTIERRWKYQRVLDGKSLTPDYKLIKHSGRYLPESKQLRVNETGEYYYFNLKQRTLLTGSIQYQKL